MWIQLLFTIGLTTCAFHPGITSALQVGKSFSLSEYGFRIGQLYREESDCDENETCENLCDGQPPTCNPFIEEVICYVRIFNCTMPRTDLKNVVVVIGLTGAGKSTLTQFVANNTNTLRANCPWDVCDIIDDSNTIGGGFVSKTLLPNMVVHNSTDGISTPFFDIPGFSDTRNVSSEVANTFAISEALRRAEYAKFIIVMLDDGINGADRSMLLKLLTFVSSYFADANQFVGGISLVINRVAYNTSSYNFFNYVLEVLNYVTRSIEHDDVQFDPNLKDNALIILNELTKCKTVGGSDLINIGAFYNPETEGLLMDDPVFQIIKENLTRLIFDELSYVPITNKPFGFPLSDAAKNLLNSITGEISKDIEEELTEFARGIETHIIETFPKLLNSSNADFEEFTFLVLGVISANYSFVEESGTHSFYLNSIIREIALFGNGYASQTIENLNNFAAFLDFVSMVMGSVEISPQLWVRPLENIESQIRIKLADYAELTLNRIFNFTTVAAAGTATKLIGDLSNIDTIQAKLEESAQVRGDVQRCIQQLESLTRTGKLADLVHFVEIEYSRLRKCQQSCVSIGQVNIVELIMLFGEFGWRSLDWVGSHGINLEVPILNDFKVHTFLNNILRDVSKSNVHSSPVVDLNNWWSATKNMSNKVTFDEFWTHSRSLNFSSTAPPSNRDDIFDLFRNSQNAFSRLNLLFNSAFMSPRTLSTPGQVVVVGRFLSVQKFLTTLKNHPNVAVLAMDTLFLDSNLDLKGPSKINPKLAIISPKVWVAPQSQILLQGDTGANPPPNNGGSGAIGAQGSRGFDAGTLYWVYQNITGASITIFLNGGKGGTGQPGNAGASGYDMNPQSFNVDSDDCAAWGGGDIRIRVYPNTCNSGECCRCHAGDDGVKVWIDGHAAGVGPPGGSGGQGGSGGMAGASFLVKVDVAQPTQSYGDTGPGGDGGLGAAGGVGGRYGDKTVVTVDDVGTVNGKKCKQLARYYERDNRRGSNGQMGWRGTTGVGSGTKSVNINDYRAYVTMFITEMETLKTNEFFREQTIHFLDHFNKHGSVPK